MSEKHSAKLPSTLAPDQLHPNQFMSLQFSLSFLQGFHSRSFFTSSYSSQKHQAAADSNHVCVISAIAVEIPA
jgi:hypothetical protein